MQSSRMAIPKKFEEKLTRWFKLPGDVNEEQSIKRAEYQTVGWYSQIAQKNRSLADFVNEIRIPFVQMWHIPFFSHFLSTPPPSPMEGRADT